MHTKETLQRGYTTRQLSGGSDGERERAARSEAGATPAPVRSGWASAATPPRRTGNCTAGKNKD